MSLNQAIVLAGGKGTSFYHLNIDLEDTSKGMLKIKDKPLLEHIIRSLNSGGVEDFIFAVHHKKDQIKNYFEDGSNFGANITYLEGDGKGHVLALQQCQDLITDNEFLVCYGDHIFSKEFVKEHISKHEQKGISTSYISTNDYWADSLMKLDKDGKLLDILGWELEICGPIRRKPDFMKDGYVTASHTAHVFKKEVFDTVNWNEEFIRYILKQLSEREQAHVISHKHFDARVHTFWCYLATLKFVEPERYANMIERVGPPGLRKLYEEDIESGNFGWAKANAL